MKLFTSLLLLLLEFSSTFHDDKKTVIVTANAAVITSELKESMWGRVYLRNGLAPIQYFRDDFGGPMATHEISFYFPKRAQDHFGCERLPEAEYLEIMTANRSAVLVVDRGECTFERKARLADQMGAGALMIVSPTDDVSAPVAVLKDEDGDISIASVMVRRTAGDMLRAVAKQMTVYGRLIPMTCERKPYTCKPRLEVEADYMEAAPARSGAVFSDKQGDHDGSRLGDFLTASYGSVLHTMTPFPLASPLDSKQACADFTDESITHLKLSGKAVLISAGDVGQCSELDKVSNAQRHGASVVLLVRNDNATLLTHPIVEMSWHAYNITIPVLAVSSKTGDHLIDLKDAWGEAASLHFEVSNNVATAWELLAQHSQRSAWPKRLNRCSKTLAKLLTQIRGLGDDHEVKMALKAVFLNVVGGKLHDWEAIAHSDGDTKELHDAPNGRTIEKVIQATKKKMQISDEL